MRLKEQMGWLNCSRCKLHEFRNKVVLGRGSRKAQIMFIGEGPGHEEDMSGEPFVGPSGDLLDKFLNVFEINRADVFIDNIVGCRPFVMDEGKKVTRKPANEEVLACKPRLQQSIYLVDPTIIVSLGGPALQALTGVGGITGAAGNVFETEVSGWYLDIHYPVYAMFHPAYILRQTPPGVKEKKTDERHPLRKTYKHFEDMLDTLRTLNKAYYGVETL